MIKNDGGPAFPVAAGPRDGYGNPSNPPQRGMTLRDWFAGQALVGLMSYPGDEVSGNWHNNSSTDGVARRAYELADAMIAERDI